jgi:hypothetical protein
MKSQIRSAALALAFLIAPVFAGTALPAIAADAIQDARFEQDRKSILAMAGDFHVNFDFRENTSFLDGYEPIEAKRSGGYESVRVIEDTGKVIRLQHLLVVSDDDDKPVVVKHWRQDWTYEPASVLTYERHGKWVQTAVPAEQRKGAWSQTVWQTDDSPRYGGWGQWRHENGVDSWTSNETRRPLARRDAVRKPPYDYYLGVNRHALTPFGWVHEQDNAKLGEKDGKTVTFVHETVTNTYRRNPNYQIAAAENYWAKSKDYWAALRKAWDEASAKGTVTVTEEPENGSIVGPTLMGLGQDIVDGKTTTAAAIPQGLAAIEKTTKR